MWRIVSHARRRIDADGDEQPPEQRGDRRLAHPAERQRRARDAELRGGDVPVEVLQHALHRAGAGVPALRERVDLAPPRAHHREFRHHEERVGAHDQQNGEQPPADPARRQLVSPDLHVTPCRMCSSKI
jgi:hypothetical protein